MKSFKVQKWWILNFLEIRLDVRAQIGRNQILNHAAGDISNAVSKLKAQSSKVSFATILWKVTFKLEKELSNMSPNGIGWTSLQKGLENRSSLFSNKIAPIGMSHEFEIPFQNFQIFHNISLNFAKFRGGHFRKACRSRKKESKQLEITCKQSEPVRTISMIENLDGHCAINNARRILWKGSTLLRGCWSWIKRSFWTEFLYLYVAGSIFRPLCLS